MRCRPWFWATVLVSTALASQDSEHGQYLQLRHFANATTPTTRTHPIITPPPTTRDKPLPCSTCSVDCPKCSALTTSDTISDTATSSCSLWWNSTECPTTTIVSNITLQTSSATGNCSGSITFFDTIPSIVTSTFTETNSTVTLYGTNTIYTAAAISFPTPFCAAFAVSATVICSPNPCPPSFTPALSFAPFTSTVIVTKKSPVIVIADTTAPPSFKTQDVTLLPGSGAQKTGGGRSGEGGGNSGGGGGGGGGGGANSGDGNGGHSGGSSGEGLGSIIVSIFSNPFVHKPSPTPGRSGSGGTGGGGAPGGNTPGGNIPGGGTGGGGGSGSGSGGTGGGGAVGNPGSQLVVTNVNGVPLIVGPGGVIVGAQVINPGNGATIVTVNGQVFSVGPSKVIAPGTTIAIPVAVVATTALGKSGTSANAGSPAAMTTMTVGGVVFTLGQHEVIMGSRTFAIGPGAVPVTTRINGQVLTIEAAGVVFPSTTVGPEGALVNPSFSVATIGGLVVSLDATEAVISGTTYLIGSGSTPEITVIGGQTISMGPGGVSLALTTIPALPSNTALSPFTGGAKKQSSSFSSVVAVALASLFWF